MKRVGNLFTRITGFDNLLKATRLASRGGKKFKASIARFLLNQEKEILQLQRELQTKTYCPRCYRQFTIHDPKKRTISVADFRDRVVYHALCLHIGPLLDRALIYDSYACRQGKGTHRALDRAQDFIRSYHYFLKLDIAKYFSSINQAKLKQMLARKIKDREVLWLIATIIDHAPPDCSTGYGLPVGNLTSQHFANFYLSPLDYHIKQQLNIKHYIRYMDDMLLLANDKTTLWDTFQESLHFLHDVLELNINERATLLSTVYRGVPFLGFNLFPNKRRIRKQNWNRFKKKFRTRQKQYLQGKISREHLIDSITSMTEFINTGDTCRLRRKFVDNFALEL